MPLLDLSLAQPKAKLRHYFKAQRQQFSAEMLRQKSLQIAQNVLANIELSKLQAVHIFLPILAQKEINTFMLIDLLREAAPDLQIVVSRTLINQIAMPTYLLTPDTKLQTNDWGIPEPDLSAQTFDNQLIDLVFIPLLCFDEQGFRVGYGKGFYDRFVAQCRPDVQKVGLSFFTPVAQISDCHEQDLRLDLAICPDRLYKFAPK